MIDFKIHMQAHAVLVNVSDEVRQLQALSFGANCEQPATGATVTSDNAL